MSLFVSWVLVLSFMLLQLHTTEFLAPLILISVWLFQLLVSFFISQSDKGEHEGDTLPSRPLFNHLLCVISSISWFVLSYKVTNERKKRWTQTSQKNPTSFSLSSSKEINKQKNMSSRSNDLFFFSSHLHPFPFWSESIISYVVCTFLAYFSSQTTDDPSYSWCHPLDLFCVHWTGKGGKSNNGKSIRKHTLRR